MTVAFHSTGVSGWAKLECVGVILVDEGRGSWSSSPRHPALMGLALHWTSAYLDLRAPQLSTPSHCIVNPFVVQHLYNCTSALLSCPQISPPRAARHRAGKSPWICNSIVRTNSCWRQQTWGWVGGWRAFTPHSHGSLPSGESTAW